MEKRQEKEYDMFVLMDTYVDQIPVEIKDQMPSFLDYQVLFREATADARAQIESQRIDRSGNQEEKTAVREELTIMALDVSLKEAAFAKNTGDNVLLRKIDFTLSDLSRMSDVAFAADVNTIITEANTNAAVLLPYGVTPEKIAALTLKLGRFQELLPTPQLGINITKAATKALNLAMIKARVNLEAMETLVNGLRFSEPEFYSDFMNARRVGKPGFHILSGRGQVTDEAGMPLALVRMVCESLGLNRRTTKHGRFMLRNMREGRHYISFIRPGYVTVVVAVDIFPGVRAEINVVMVAH